MAKQSKLNIPPTLEEVVKFFTDNGWHKSVGEHVFNYYNDADWHDSRGNKIINWKQKCRGVWMSKLSKSTVIGQQAIKELKKEPKFILNTKGEKIYV